MSTLGHIKRKFNLDLDQKLPIEIRDFNREGMASLFHELGFKVGVEVGVRDGEYSTTLCRNIPGVKIYGIDPYEPHEGYLDHTRKSTFEKFEQQAHDKLAVYQNYQFVRKYSVDAVKDFADNSLDFVYIDGDHAFWSVAHDIHFWSQKVRPDGVVSGDDYFKHKGPAYIHVYNVVNSYTEAYKINPWFVIGAQDKVPGEKRDSGRSWMWVKA